MSVHWLDLDEPTPESPDPVGTSLKWFDGPEEPEVSSSYAGVTERMYTWCARATDTKNDDGTTDFIASTGSVDRMGDVIDQASWRLGPFRENAVILYEHYDPVVGKALKVGIATTDDGTKRLALRVKWDDSEVNPKGMLAAHQHRNGFRNAVSVGFYPGATQSRTELATDHPLYVDEKQTPRWRAGYLYTRCELLEVSTVAVPANREALQLSMAARQLATDGDLVAAAKTLIKGVAPRRDASELLEAFRNDPRFRTLVLSMVLGQKAPAPPPTPAPAKKTGPDWVQRS